jgi:hypothetical protein
MIIIMMLMMMFFNYDYNYDVDVDRDVDDIISYMLYRGGVEQLIRKSRDSHLAAEQTHNILFRSIIRISSSCGMRL